MEKDLKDLKDDLTQFSKDLLKANEPIVNKIATIITKSIKDRWLKGQGVEENGAETNDLKPLAKSTIKQREYKKKNGKLSNQTSPGKSNLIDSGKTFKKLGYKKTKDNLEIGVMGEREEILGFTEDGGRPIMYLSKQEEKLIEDILDSEIDKLLNK